MSPPGNFSHRRAPARTRRLLRCLRPRRIPIRSSTLPACSRSLPVDAIMEIFARVGSLADLASCAACCRDWRRIIYDRVFDHQRRSILSRQPSTLVGVFHDFDVCGVPSFVSANGAAVKPLDLGFLLETGRRVRARLLNSRGGKLLLHIHHRRDLNLLVYDPFDLDPKSKLRYLPSVPELDASKHHIVTTALVDIDSLPPNQFRVITVVFEDVLRTKLRLCIFSSASSRWASATIDTRLPWCSKESTGQPVVIGNTLYKLFPLCILAVDITTMELSTIKLPCFVSRYYHGSQWIGLSEHGKLCFFMLSDMSLLSWVLDPAGNWAPEPVIKLAKYMKLSSTIADHPLEYRLVRIVGFGEVERTLFFSMADDLIVFWLKDRRMKALRENGPWPFWLLNEVFPFESKITFF